MPDADLRGGCRRPVRAGGDTMERIAEYRTELAGKYQVPLLPTTWEIVGAGETEVVRDG